MMIEVVEALMELVKKQIDALGQYDQYGPEVRKTMVVDQPVFLIKKNNQDEQV